MFFPSTDSKLQIRTALLLDLFEETASFNRFVNPCSQNIPCACRLCDICSGTVFYSQLTSSCRLSASSFLVFLRTQRSLNLHRSNFPKVARIASMIPIAASEIIIAMTAIPSSSISCIRAFTGDIDLARQIDKSLFSDVHLPMDILQQSQIVLPFGYCSLGFFLRETLQLSRKSAALVAVKS